MTRFLRRAFFAGFIALPLLALRAEGIGRVPLEIILTEGRLAISDGISLFTFQKDGVFTGIPLREGGRAIEGRWKSWRGSPRVFVIEGEWKWAGKIRVPRDQRTMTLSIIRVSEKKIRYKKGEARECEFRITDLQPQAAR